MITIPLAFLLSPARALGLAPLGGALRGWVCRLRRRSHYSRLLKKRARVAGAELAKARSLDSVWDATVSASAPLAPSSMYLLAVDLRDRPGQHKQLCVWRSGCEASRSTFSTAYPIDFAEGHAAVLELYWDDERCGLSDEEFAYMDHLVSQLERPLARHIDPHRHDLVVLRARPRPERPPVMQQRRPQYDPQ